MKKKYSLIIFLLIVFYSKAQQGCDLNAIRAAMTGAGCTELPSCQSSCSMYFYNPSSLSGVAAQQFAESLGANLISVQTAAENTCISTALTTNGFGGTIWIGFTDDVSEGSYYWYDGSPVVFTNWNAGEPNNSGNEDCTQIFPNGLWNDLNCNGGSSRSVIEVSLCPQITASNDTSICNSTAANLVCSDAMFGSQPYTYTWSDGQIGQNISVSPSITTTYTVTATDRYDCFVTEDVVVTVVDNVTASFTSSNYCVYEEVQFTDNSTITSPDMLANSGWYFGDTSPPRIGTQITHLFPSAGNYTVSHAVSTINGCIGTAVETITVYDAPIADFNFIDACANVEINFEDNSSGLGTTVLNWEWDFGDALGIGSSDIESYTYATSGSYNVELIVEDNEGCRDTAVKSVTIFEDPIADFNFTNSCLYDTVNFIDASSVGNPDNITTWSWDINGDLIADYTTQNSNHKFSSVGTYDVTLNVESNNNCSNSLTQTLTIFPVPQASFSASSECVNGPATNFINTSTISQGAIVLNGWNFGDGNISTQQTPTNNYQIASTYPVTLAVVSDLGCADTVTFSVDVLGKPTAAFTQDTTNGCAPLCVAFTDTSFDDIPIIEWNWSFENVYGESYEQNPTHCYSTTGEYNVGLIIRNAQGCKDTLEQLNLITVYPQPISDFTLNPTSTDVLNSTIDFTNNSTDASAWVWDFNDGTEENLIDYNTSHTYADTGVFEVELTVINSFLCSDTSYQTVEILPVDNLFVPSAFSPNGDGKNDVLYARGYIGTMYFAVFDRLGKKVFESEDKETGWDGLINGKNALEGVYSWFLQAEVNGTAYKQKGDVTLVR